MNKQNNICLARPPASAILDATLAGIRGFHDGQILCPQKIYTPLGASGIAISMLASRPDQGVSLIKNYFETSIESAHKGRSFSTFQFFREDQGAPLFSFQDDWITTARSSATTSLFIERLAVFRTGKVVIVGPGALGRDLLHFLPLVCPEGTEFVALARSQRSARAFLDLACTLGHEDRCRAVIGKNAATDDLSSADVVIATAGHGGIGLIDTQDTSPGTLLVYVGYGFSKSMFDAADRLLTTSQAQMNVTCPEFQNPDGSVRIADHELEALLDKEVVAPVGAYERVMFYNSGLAACDLTVAEIALAKLD